MPLSHYDLRVASHGTTAPLAKSLNEARARQIRSVFVCHSHLDEKLVRGLAELLRRSGWNVYIDWEDAALPKVPDARTASEIRDRIRSCAFLLFLATQNSLASRWCPWEIGYADGHRGAQAVIIVPTVDDDNHMHGQEYLGLYRHLDVGASGNLAVWEPGEKDGTRVRSL